jgi:glucose-6-phosphate isomerase
MLNGKKVNVTEKRAALHTALRDFSDEPMMVDGIDYRPEIERVKAQLKSFSSKVREGCVTGTTGKPFRHFVVVGIGGSYLGTECVANALGALSVKNRKLHFLSNVDPEDFVSICSKIEPESTLWIIISKSYTTTETLANENRVRLFLKKNQLKPSDHMVTVTSKGSPGDDPGNPVLASFHMFDFVGGRYSVSSAVGGVPLSLMFGYETFERFLNGAHEMDQHAAGTESYKNIPFTAALMTIWNRDYLGYPALGIIPYSTRLSRLPAHIQQLHMESNGKGVDIDGNFLEKPAGVIILGEPGTNAQHSFFQMAHQGPSLPMEFIGVLNDTSGETDIQYKGVTRHQELFANCMAQAKALAEGKKSNENALAFPGNRPSATILIDDLSPENVGKLISFYEAKTVFEGLLWHINPFDQFGVQLGKVTAGQVRKEMAKKNENPAYLFEDTTDRITRFYLDTFFSRNS